MRIAARSRPLVDGTSFAEARHHVTEGLPMRRSKQAHEEQKRIWMARLVPNATRPGPVLPLERAVQKHLEAGAARPITSARSV
jgi:hypothetical protein